MANDPWGRRLADGTPYHPSPCQGHLRRILRVAGRQGVELPRKGGGQTILLVSRESARFPLVSHRVTSIWLAYKCNTTMALGVNINSPIRQLL